jgi:hypothetical protein
MFSLAMRRFTGADDPYVLVAVGMGNDQNPTCVRHSDGDKPLLGSGMVGVVISCRQRIAKDGSRFLERKPMLSAILSVFTRVPFKIHQVILTRHTRPGNSPDGEDDSAIS